MPPLEPFSHSSVRYIYIQAYYHPKHYHLVLCPPKRYNETAGISLERVDIQLPKAPIRFRRHSPVSSDHSYTTVHAE